MQVTIAQTQETHYPVFIDAEPIEALVEKLNDYRQGRRALIVINEKVNKLYPQWQDCEKFVLKDGEEQKNFKNYQKILEQAQKMKLERSDLIIAIGGGVVGDIAGFAAATYLRGIDFVQVPTTLLACVDSSVGGKVAINTDFGKNLIGSFYQPKAVFINLNFLQTLDDRQFTTGLAEVVKYAFIEQSCEHYENYDLFKLLNENFNRIKDFELLKRVIEICISLKASVVSKDEKEKGLRRILNFGHTYAHALEKITNYKKFTHGEAVFYGMRYALRIALTQGFISKEYSSEAVCLLDKYFVFKPMNYPPKQMLELMKSDKKVEGGQINFVLPVGYQRVEVKKQEMGQV